jgi:hypothetical protein
MEDATRATRSLRARYALRVEPVELGVHDVAHPAH